MTASDPVKAVQVDGGDDAWQVSATIPTEGEPARATLAYLLLCLADIFEQTDEGAALFACFQRLEELKP